MKNNQQKKREVHSPGDVIRTIRSRFLNSENNGIRSLWQRMLFRTLVRARHATYHMQMFMKWIVMALIMGFSCGLIGAVFRKSLDYVTDFSRINPWTIYLLPAAGLLIICSYQLCDNMDDKGTDSILQSARGESAARLCTAPLVFISTVLTHLCMGSSGREGAALQIGGGIGSFLGRRLHLESYEQQMAVMCGMSASFCALLGAPLTASVFAIEVAGVGTVFYAGLVPSVLASMTAMVTARFLGVSPFHFVAAGPQPQDPGMFVKIIALGMFIAVLSIIYCSTIHNARALYIRLFRNPYLRIVVGGILVIILTLLIGNYDYNGLGMPVLLRALNGEAEPYAFALKLLLTAVTLGAGYKGGEIVPTFFIGAVFGAYYAPFFGLDPMFGAEACMIGMFCGAVNCPLASILLSVEFFGADNFIFFGTIAAVSYMLSGYYSLYSGQKFMNSKLIPVPFERNAN